MSSRLYADNAATTFPKPPGVLDAMRAYAADVGVAPGRAAYHEAVEADRLLTECRGRLARLLGAEAPEQVVFTLNGSAALNQAVKGLLRQGDHVVTTTMEHNGLLRPLNALRAERGVEVTHVRPDPTTGRVRPDRIFAAVRSNTRLIGVVHADNVTGTLQPVDEVGAEARRRGIPLLVDAAQTAGHVPIDVRDLNIDLLAVPGHKGLLGPLGTGALYIRPGLESSMRPLVEGGTGSVSERPVQPDFMPDKFESGSHNAIGLAGLRAALQWIESTTVESLQRQHHALGVRFLERVSDVGGLTVFGSPEPSRRVAVFSIRLHGMEPAELSTLLETEFGIQTRSGFHCAPLAHETIGTRAGGGTTRLSFGPFNTPADVDRCGEALVKLAAAAPLESAS